MCRYTMYNKVMWVTLLNSCRDKRCRHNRQLTEILLRRYSVSSAFWRYFRTSASSFSTRAPCYTHTHTHTHTHMPEWYKRPVLWNLHCYCTLKICNWLHITCTFRVSISSLYVLAAFASAANSCLCESITTHNIYPLQSRLATTIKCNTHVYNSLPW